MAINIWGTQGTVNEVQWAKLAEGFGQKYTLVNGNPVTASGRNLSIPPRLSVGAGVAVENTTAESRAVPVPAAGQWFLLVLRRQWGISRGASFELILGIATSDAVQTTPPATLPATRNKTPGLIDDEPIAWVHARASTTTLALWQMQTKRDGRVPGLWAMYDPNEQGIFTIFSESNNSEYVWFGGAWTVSFQDTGWITLTVIGGSPHIPSPPKSRKLNGVVYVTGESTPSANGQVAFVLPEGFRPINTFAFWLDRNTANVRCAVFSNGNVQYIGPGGDARVNWAGIPSFPGDL